MRRKASFNKIVSMLVLTMFSLSLISAVPKAAGNNIENSSFTNYLDGWTVKGDIDAASGKSSWGYDDSYSLGYWKGSAYEVWTEQTITGIENGFYKVEAYVASGGGQEAHYIYANDFGGTGARTSIPVCNDFTKVVLNFEVTNNQVTIGFYAKASAGNWSNYDAISLIKVENEYTFLKGGDLTMVNWIEDEGGVFYDENGEARDVFHILAESGFNFVRLRTHNDVGREHGSITNPDYYLPDGYQNTEDLLNLALRSKEMGMSIEVTLNYSDWWPNAGTQEIPSSWRKEIEGMNDEEAINRLEELVYEYTKDIMEQLAAQGTTPEFISLGNEMQDGILYPYGRAATFDVLARFLNAGYKAVKEVSTNTQVVLHLDMAGDTEKYVNFFDRCESYKVNYDIIGASYYPFWTRTSVEDIIPWFNQIGEKYQKKILIMETGYNWNPTKPDGWPGQLSDNGPETHESSPQGQKEFLDELFNGIRTVEKNWVIGDLYWDPVMIDLEGIGWAMERGEAEDGSQDKAGSNVVSNTTLFDFDGYALPSLKSFRDNTEGTRTGILSGSVTGEGGNKIRNAQVEIEINGEKITKTTDRYGNFFMVGLLPSDDVKITAAKQGYGEASIVTEVRAAEVTKAVISLRGGQVTGSVKDSNGNNLSGVKISSVVDDCEYAAYTDENGMYSLTDIPEGNGYAITASKIGYESQTLEGIAVVNGDSTNGVDFTLSINSGNLKGKILAEDGNTLAEVKVILQSADGKKYEAKTNEAGVYELSFIDEGVYSLTASLDGYEDYSINEITVKAKDNIDLADIIMKKAFGSIKGIAVDPDNNRLSDVEVTILLANEEKFKAVTDENGEFIILEVVDDNRYIIEGVKDGYGNAKIMDVEVRPNSRSEVVLRLSEKIEVINGDFDLGTLEGWNVVDDTSAISAQDRTGFGNDAPSGKFALSLWNDKAYSASISQKIDNIKNGKYEITYYLYNGGDQNSAYMYVKDGEDIITYDLQTTTNWTKVSQTLWINNESIEIGFDFDAKAGCWTVIDSVELNYITSIDYAGLEEKINECSNIKNENYTEESWNNFEQCLADAKAALVKVKVTQEEVNEAKTKLINAQNNLTINEADDNEEDKDDNQEDNSGDKDEEIAGDDNQGEEITADDNQKPDISGDSGNNNDNGSDAVIDQEEIPVDNEENTEIKEETIKSEKDEEIKKEEESLPITGAESSRGLISAAALVLGGMLIRKKNK